MRAYSSSQDDEPMLKPRRRRSTFHTLNLYMIKAFVVILITLTSYAFYQNDLVSVAVILALHTLFMVWLLQAISDFNYRAYMLYPLLFLLPVLAAFQLLFKSASSQRWVFFGPRP